jgi:uncharacterized membrane protein YphA (DoxX/SURF4 family)
MKAQKILYWVVTGLVAAGMIMSGFMYLTKSPEMIGAFQTLGFPVYFMLILGAAKLLGAIALLAPVGNRFKEWAYAGFMFTFVGATSTHIITNTPWISPVVFLALLASSYVLWIKVRVAGQSSQEPAGRVQHTA